MSNIATTIEQSKHLLELGLDTKTADMVWIRYAAGGYRLEVLHRELFERIMETDIAACRNQIYIEKQRTCGFVLHISKKVLSVGSVRRLLTQLAIPLQRCLREVI